MSKIDELIETLCQDGVEFKQLWEVTAWDKRFNAVENYKQTSIIKYKYLLAKDLKNLQDDNGDVKLLSTGYYDAYTTEEKAGNYLVEGEIVAIPWGGTAIVKYYKGKFVTADNRIATSIDSRILNNRFLYYFMSSKIDLIQSFYRGSGIQHPSMNSVLSMNIPVPPLEVQNEIVRILDNFSALEAELEAELEARTKQYNYYLNKLLDFSGKKVQSVLLGDIADFKYGFTDIAKNQGNARFIRITDIENNGKLININRKYIEMSRDSEAFLLKKGDLLMARTGATYGKTMLFNEDYPAVYASFLIRIRFKKGIVLPEYYWHFAQSKLYWNQANKLVSKAGQPQFNANVLKSIEICIPSIDEQKRIVDILNRFDLLCSDLINGLPAEISARRQQYEYYRNKLLTF